MQNKQSIARALLTWFYAHRRDMPWRVKIGTRVNPYHVFLSEIMLQQTTSATVHDYFVRFVKKWRDIDSLAKADIDAVLTEWRGLGYYARARNLHASAQYISQSLGGKIPETVEELKKLKGIGDYSASAIAAIAFNKPHIAIDGNVRRVGARFMRIERLEKDEFYRKLLQFILPKKNDSPHKQTQNGDMQQALMELGSLICRPKNPKCTECPIAFACKGQDIAENLPILPKKIIPTAQYCAAFILKNKRGEILLQKRPVKGLLGGMVGFPLSELQRMIPEKGAGQKATAKKGAGAKAQMQIWLANPENRIGIELPFDLNAKLSLEIPAIKHVFTHIRLLAFPIFLTLDDGRNIPLPAGYFWAKQGEINNYPLPKLMQKIYESVFEKPIATK